MALAAIDIEQVKTIVTEMWKEERQNAASTASFPDGNNRKFELLERIVRVEEELKYLREDMKQLREDMNRQLKIVLWVVSGWGFLTGLLVTVAPYVFK